ncbi:MAG: hypothetical protein WBA46_07300 [Thermomicrobiales bacterium]
MNSRMRVKAIPALIVASFGGSLLTSSHILAHQGHATPAERPTDFPTIDLVVDEQGVMGMPASLEAGRYLFNLTGPAGTPEFQAGFMILRLPEGITAEQAWADTQAAEMGPPEWFYQTHFGGGLQVQVGATETWGVLELPAGDWLVIDSMFSQPPVAVAVTGEMAADVATPASTVTLRLSEFQFEVAAGSFALGDNIVEVANTGAQPHHTIIFRVPDGTTKEAVDGLGEFFMTGTPVAGMLDESAMMPHATLSDISSGVTMWNALSLEAGTYLLICFIEDPDTGMPHFMSGMTEVFVIT